MEYSLVIVIILIKEYIVLCHVVNMLATVLFAAITINSNSTFLAHHWLSFMCSSYICTSINFLLLVKTIT